MKSGIIQAALEGKEAYSGKSYFFNQDRYHRYDWKTDRAENGYPKDNRYGWGLPSGFSIDAAINGEASYEGKAYFFIGSKYYRYDWKKEVIDQGYPSSISAWGFPSSFASGIDAAVNGVGKYAGKAYFFKGNDYIRYDWKKDKVDEGYPMKLSAWNLPAPFSSGVDAAINGQGKYANKLYFFKGNQYLRYNWLNDTVEAVNPILDNWPQVVELIQFGVAKKKVYEWLALTMPMVKAYIANLNLGTPFIGNKALFETALEKHFHIPVSMNKVAKLSNLNVINDDYNKVLAALNNSSNIVRARNTAEVALDYGNLPSPIPPGYTWYNGTINFTNKFPNFGPLCQAAMVLHEPVHYVDNTPDNDFYEHGSDYDILSTNQAIHNPSSYVCFAQHLFYKSDVRYGAGKPTI